MSGEPFSLCPHVGENRKGESELSFVSPFKGTNCLHEDPDLIPKGPPPNTITMRRRLQHRSFEGTHIFSPKIPVAVESVFMTVEILQAETVMKEQMQNLLEVSYFSFTVYTHFIFHTLCMRLNIKINVFNIYLK